MDIHANMQALASQGRSVCLCQLKFNLTQVKSTQSAKNSQSQRYVLMSTGHES